MWDRLRTERDDDSHHAAWGIVVAVTSASTSGVSEGSLRR